jgi:hypothetical protein
VIKTWVEKLWLLPIYVLFLYTWLMTGLGKFMSGGVPDFFIQKFGETFLAQVPGLTVAYYQIAFFELAAGLVFLISLLKLEFLPGRDKSFLLLGLFLSQVTFAMLGFGLRLTQDHAGAASIFFYMGATAVFGMLVWNQNRGTSR